MKKSQKFFLIKSIFHQLDNLTKTSEKTFEVRVCSKSFFFSKEQIIILSNSAFDYISTTKRSFDIEMPSDLYQINQYELVNCFNRLYLLFISDDSIQIDFRNVVIYKYLATKLQNRSLEIVCDSVSISQTNQFFLSSKHFKEIGVDKLHLLNNLQIRLKGNEMICCNSFYASMISKTIYQKLISQNVKVIDFSNFGKGFVLKSIFDLLKGKSFKISKFQSEDIYQSIQFLQFLSLSSYMSNKFDSQGIAFNFYKMSSYSLLDLSPDSIKYVISSNYLHLKNECQLFDFIYRKIEKDRSNLSLLIYMYGAAVTDKTLSPLIQELRLKEIDYQIFVFLKNCLKFGYLTSSPAQELISFPFQNTNYLWKQKMKLVQLYNSLPSTNIPLNPQIVKAMSLLKQNQKEKGFKFLKKLADLGDPEACWRTAACYSRPIGVEFNLFHCSRYSRTAKEYDLVEGYYWLACASKLQKDLIENMLEACERNFPPALFRLGDMIISQKISEFSLEDGIRYMEMAGESNEVIYASKIAYYYQNGSRGFPINKTKSSHFQEIALKNLCSDSSFLADDYI
jgi:hypothetical protein